MIFNKLLCAKKKVINKILNKHNISIEEVEEIIYYDKPIYFRTRKNRYMCIGKNRNYITIIFEMKKNAAELITAYQSSKWQRKLHKRKI